MSSDILDVLSIERGHKKQKVEQPKAKPLTGINRELYELLGQNTPPVPVRNQQKFKDRLNALAKPASWKWTAFKNGARSDDLRLHHWVKGEINIDNPYKFEKYNIKLNIPTFTKEEYDLLNDEENKDESWDYDETCYLFELANAFDLKWVIINDRYNYENKERTLEELQERFYSTCQRILIHENEIDESSQNSNLISNLNFNKNKEVARKLYLNRLLERSPAEIAEEESLLIEAKKFEVTAKKTISERSSLLQLLDSPQPTGSISQYLSSQGLTQLYNSLMTEKRKRRIDSPAPENPLTALNEKIKQQQLLKQKQLQNEKYELQKKKKENPIYTLFAKNLTPQEEESFGIKIHAEKISLGVTLRSSKITTYKQGVQTKISGVLNELGLGKKPVLITEKVVKKQEELLKTINTMLDLKRQLDKLDAESRILK